MKFFFNKLIKYYIAFIEKKLPFFFIQTPFMSSLYYLLFSSKFRREQHSVLNGKIKYLKSSKFRKDNIYNLIRNIHRIEKGLLMKNRKRIFALSYIKETTEIFMSVWNQEKTLNDKQFIWFFDVLSEYFNTSGSHPLVDELKTKFKTFTSNYNRKKNTIPPSIPYCREIDNKADISYELFFDLVKYRRSVRWFINKPVPHELIDKAILAANQSPSACNRQPFQYRIIDEPTLLKNVSKLPMGVKGYEDGIKMMIVVIGNLDAYFDERDRHLIYIDASLANMTFMLSLETLGLSSCPINWPDIEKLEIQMEKTLGLEKHQRPIMCMAVGYPDLNQKVAFSEKRNIEYIRKYN